MNPVGSPFSSVLRLLLGFFPLPPEGKHLCKEDPQVTWSGLLFSFWVNPDKLQYPRPPLFSFV